MQILPDYQANTSLGFFSSTGGDSGANFMEAMKDALDSVAGGDYSSTTAALADDSANQLVEAPYTQARYTDDGVTYTLSEVCFTKQELHELRNELLKEGAPAEALNQFNILADQPDGATLAQVMASLTGKTSPNFSEDDAHSITALLGQIDPSGQLATDALDLMRQGRGQAALDLIAQALGDMGMDMGIEVDQASILALGRGLGLNQDSLNGLLKNFGGRNSLTLNAAQFDLLMQPAQNQFMQEAANQDKLNAALEKTLKQVITKARDRMEKEKAATALEDRRVQQSKILIDRTVQQNSRDMLDSTVTGDAFDERHQAPMPEKTPEQVNAWAQNAQNTHSASNDQTMPNGQHVQNAHFQEQAESRQGKHETFGQNSQEKNNDDGWQSLLGKVGTTPLQTPRADSIVYSMIQGNLAQVEGFAPSQESAGQAQLAQHLASQVEQGMLTAMRDGSTRLDLQLHPAELGTIAITLVARNGEITAQIRSEKSETAEMMTRQLDSILANLEEQGLKVDKIEVQLQNRDDSARNAFDNLGQHNARQEENAFRQELRHLRNLANIRNLDRDTSESILAQRLHTEGQTAQYAAQSLHVIA